MLLKMRRIAKISFYLLSLFNAVLTKKDQLKNQTFKQGESSLKLPSAG
jgi:hypothetical protein